MKDFKFRAWREETKDMMLNNTLLQLLDLSVWSGYMVEPLNVVWMQFTGIIDKNGVEIYEGDILEHYAHDYSHKKGNCDGVIFWDEQDACFIGPGLPSEWPRGEVIGNTHQNPELLTNS